MSPSNEITKIKENKTISYYPFFSETSNWYHVCAIQLNHKEAHSDFAVAQSVRTVYIKHI